MPRDGSEIYHIPAGTEGIPDTTIESDRYNTFIHDVEYDLNFPRPITAGGTGSTNSADALAELGAEMSSQVVTNYDSQLWTPGSFYSAGSATNPPVAGHAFVGWVVSSDPLATPPANNNVVVHARDQNDVVVPGRLWVREKKAGVWGSWSMDGTGLSGNTPPLNPPDNTLWWDNVSGMLFVYYNDGNSKQWVVASPQPDVSQFLLKAGDTMQGTLGLHAPPVNALDAANKAYVDAIPASMQPQIDTKVNKAGDTMTGALTISAGGMNVTGPIAIAGNVSLTGAMTLSGQVVAPSYVSNASATTGAYYFGTSGNVSVVYDGTSFNFNGGAVVIPSGGLTISNGGVAASGSSLFGDVWARRSATAGVYYFGGNGAAYNYYDGTNFNFIGGQLNQSGSIALIGYNTMYFPPGNGNYGGFYCKHGDNMQLGTNHFNLYYLSGNTGLYIDNTYMGNLSLISDYRTKKDVVALPTMWDTVKALRPIKYTQADFTPPIETARRAKEGVTEPFVAADDIERWGFVAHELQETMIPHAATGEKDMPNGLQSPNQFTLIAALTKALQEAMTRIEALEAKV